MNNKTLSKILILLISLILMTSISACGVKGRLYLPDDPNHKETKEQSEQDSEHDND